MRYIFQVKGGKQWEFNTAEDLVQHLIEAAIILNLSNSEISKRTGIDQSTISRILGRKTIDPRISSVLEIATAVEPSSKSG